MLLPDIACLHLVVKYYQVSYQNWDQQLSLLRESYPTILIQRSSED
ncbi:uncharacterized protein METZ01_LOCUS318430, partial [marine metagenome]